MSKSSTSASAQSTAPKSSLDAFLSYAPEHGAQEDVVENTNITTRHSEQTTTANVGRPPVPTIITPPVVKRVLSFDIGIRTFSSNVTGLTAADELVLDHWGRDDILTGNSSAQNCLKIQTDRLCRYVADYLVDHWPIYNAQPLNKIVIEEQPLLQYNMKMRILSYVVLGCLRMLVKQSYINNGKTAPVIIYQSAKAKLTIFAKSYKPKPIQVRLDNLMQPLFDEDNLNDDDADDNDDDEEDMDWLTQLEEIYESENDDKDDDEEEMDVDCMRDSHHTNSSSKSNQKKKSSTSSTSGDQTMQRRGGRPFFRGGRPLFRGHKNVNRKTSSNIGDDDNHNTNNNSDAERERAREARRRYRDNKAHAKEQTLLILEEEPYCRRWIPWFKKLGPKCDDAGDTFLQAIYSLRNGRTNLNKLAIGGTRDEITATSLLTTTTGKTKKSTKQSRPGNKKMKTTATNESPSLPTTSTASQQQRRNRKRKSPPAGVESSSATNKSTLPTKRSKKSTVEPEPSEQTTTGRVSPLYMSSSSSCLFSAAQMNGLQYGTSLMDPNNDNMNKQKQKNNNNDTMFIPSPVVDDYELIDLT